MALCATTALAGAVLCLCVRGACGPFGGFGPVPGVVSLPFPPSRPACSALRVAGRPVRVSLTLSRWYAIPRGLCVPRARSGCHSGSPRMPLSCVCARAPAASVPPPLCGVACAPRVVPALGAGRAVPRGPCPSACPAPVPCSVWRAWGGAVRSRFPPAWLGVLGVALGRPRGGCLLLLRGASGVRRSPSPDCPPTGRAVGVRDPRVVGAGVRVWGPFSVPSACTPCGGCAPRGGSVAFVCRGEGWGGGGVRRTPRSLCLVPSLCLRWAGNKAGVTGVVLSMGGVAPHNTPVRAHPPSLGAICAASWRVGAGSLVLRSPRGSRRLGRGGGSRSGSSLGRGGDHPPCLGGRGPGPPRLAGRWGAGGGGGSRRGLPAPLLGGGLRYSILAPLVSSAHSLPACACGQGCSAAPGWGG